MESDGFRASKGSLYKEEFVGNAKTWRAFSTSIDLNYIDDGSLGMTSAAYN